MKKKKSFSKLYLYGAIGCIAVIAIVGYIYCFSSFSKSSNTEYVYIDNDDNIDSVYNKLRPFAKSIPFQAFKTLTLHSGYADHIRTGRYAIAPGDGALKTWRHMKNGLQEPVSLTIPSVRTLDKLSDEIGKKMMFGRTTSTMPCATRASVRNTVTILPPSPACSYLTPTISTGTSR